MKRILFLTTLNNTQSLKEACESILKTYGNIVEVKKVYLDEFEKPYISLEPLKKEIKMADIVLIDIRGDTRTGRELPSLVEGKDKTVCVLVAGDQKIFSLTRMGKFKGEMIFKGKEKKFDIHAYVRTKKISEITKKLGKLFPFGVLRDMKNWILAQQYYAEGGTENIKNLILLLLKEYGCVKEIGKVPPPITSDYGLYNPQERTFSKNLDSYLKSTGYDERKPTVAVLMYSGMHFDECRVIADSLYRELKDDMNLIFIASKTEFNLEALEKYLNETKVDLLLNCQYFRIHGGPYGGEPEPTYRFLQKTDVPVLIGLKSYATEIESWKESREGLDPLEVIIGITLPELNGCIEPLFVAGLRSFEDPLLGKVKATETIEDRIKRLSSRIRNWVNLRKIPNSEKKVAIITYNYPPGEKNLANAGYLDVFESLKVFLERLEKEGYTSRCRMKISATCFCPMES